MAVSEVQVRDTRRSKCNEPSRWKHDHRASYSPPFECHDAIVAEEARPPSDRINRGKKVSFSSILPSNRAEISDVAQTRRVVFPILRVDVTAIRYLFASLRSCSSTQIFSGRFTGREEILPN